MAKYSHLPPAQKERLKKLVERERDENAEDKYLESYVNYSHEKKRNNKGEIRRQKGQERAAIAE